MKNKELIIRKITGLSKEQLFLNPPPNPLPSKEGELFNEYISRLEKWEPIEHIINNTEFYSFDFYVDNRVLIPKNDTELMVDVVLKNDIEWTLIDIWTWSSCIAISIMKNTLNINKCYVVDISKKALEVSKINIEKYNLEDKIIQLKWDLLKPFLSNNNYKLDKDIIITANLPYIKDADYENMDKSVIEYEPKLALYWWKETWFELYGELLNQCLELKKTHNITVFIEIGFDQKQVAEGFLNNLGLKYEIFKDNGGLDRCIKIYFQ